MTPAGDADGAAATPRSRPGRPRTLLGRIALIIAGALLATQLVAWQLFRYYYNGPLLQESAERTVSLIRTVTAAMQVLSLEEREEFLDLIESREHIRIVYDSGNLLAANVPDQEDFLRAFAQQLRAALGADTQFFVQERGGQALWVKAAVGAEPLWIGIPRRQIEQPFPWLWVAWAGGCAITAIGAAYLLLRRVERPLRELERAARALGRGDTPAPVPVQGPEEVRNVASGFNRMLADLARLDAQRALLLAGISHDLRTPLARLRLGIELTPGDDALKADMARDIEEMDLIVRQFLDFARDDRGEAVQHIDLAQLVSETCAAHALRGRDLRVDARPGAPFYGRPVALKRALTNLVENALKYAEGTVEVSLEQHGGMAAIHVRDRGPGIDPAEHERLLRPFTRLQDARGGVGGAGLGLAIVDRIARAHGGRLRLEQREGGGLEAIVELRDENAV